MSQEDFIIGIGGENGQGIATSGNVLARIFARRGLHFVAYNSYQSIIRGGHTFLTLRTSESEVLTHGDRVDALLCLNQDTMDRHLRIMKAGSSVLFDTEKIRPGTPAEGVQLCPIPSKAITPNRLLANTVALGAVLRMLGIEFSFLEEILTVQFRKKGDAVIAENVHAAKGGYDYAGEHFTPWPKPLPKTGRRFGVITGNEALAMGGAAAGVKFYIAYPMSPATGVLVWFAKYARELGIMVRQMEDEISVANMLIGAAHAGCRAMCATSGGGFALMTEAFGAAAMMEIPVVGINVQRAGPATGVPTKTEQGDLWQALGAGQGDYPLNRDWAASLIDVMAMQSNSEFQCKAADDWRIGLVSHYLFSSAQRRGVMLRWHEGMTPEELIASAEPAESSLKVKTRRKTADDETSPQAGENV